jgi:putative ABC transport system substrate-binding protein
MMTGAVTGTRRRERDRLNRRDLLRGIAGLSLAAAGLPLGLACRDRATPSPVQQPQLRRIGILNPYDPSVALPEFVQAMAELGWVEGRNVAYEWRFAEGQFERLPAFAAELVAQGVDVIIATFGPETLAAAMQATTAVPIVIIGLFPIGGVASLARPGGNITGVTIAAAVDFWGGKLLELLKDAVPFVSRVGVLWDARLYGAFHLAGAGLPSPTEEIAARVAVRSLEATAPALGLTLEHLNVSGAEDLAPALAQARLAGVDGLWVPPHALFVNNPGAVAELALRHRLPAAGYYEGARQGLLISHNFDWAQMRRRAAVYVDKIVRGANPGDLPIERVATVSIYFNLATARALGLTIPPAVLARATEVIQ